MVEMLVTMVVKMSLNEIDFYFETLHAQNKNQCAFGHPKHKERCQYTPSVIDIDGECIQK